MERAFVATTGLPRPVTRPSSGATSRRTALLDHVLDPPQYGPRILPIYALDEIDVRASSEVVWTLLVEAPRSLDAWGRVVAFKML